MISLLALAASYHQVLAIAGSSVSLGLVIHLLLVLVIVGLICAVLWWAVNSLPLPAPFAMVARVLLVLAIALIVIYYILLPLLAIV